MMYGANNLMWFVNLCILHLAGDLFRGTFDG